VKRRHLHHDVHIARTPLEVGWKVSRHGRTMSRHRTQRNAIRAGKRLATRMRVEVITHGLDGRFRSKDSYGNESPVRDTEH